MDAPTAFAAPAALLLRARTTPHSPALARRIARHAARGPRAHMGESPGGAADEAAKPDATEPLFTQKFDPDSDTNAFGRDPKKETDFWRDAAKSVLASDPVREALEKHQALNGDTLTDEQRAYMNFLDSMDTSSAASPPPPPDPDN